MTLKKHTLITLFCLFISAIFLLVCTKTSPLYSTNDWVDPNAFFTMGKGMVSGLVPYRDLFEQKGPLLYLYHGIAYLMSHTTFIGVYLFEVINFTVFLVVVFHTVRLYAPFTYAAASLPLVSFMLLNSKSFTYGDSAEEFCLPFFAAGLYFLFRYFRETPEKPMAWHHLFLGGVFAGCTLWIKYSLLGFWFAWMVMILVSALIRKEYRSLFSQSFLFLGGMLAASVPWLIYFAVNHALDDMWFVYFWANYKYYPSGHGVLMRVYKVLSNFFAHTFSNMFFTLSAGIGLYRFCRSKRLISVQGKAALIACITMLSLGIFGGGRAYIYYYFMLAPFTVLGLIAFYDIIRVNWKDSLKISPKMAIGYLLALLISVTALFNQNAYMITWKNRETVQKAFAKVIHERENPTLLNYGYLDYGFYMAADIMPNVKYFENQNISYDAFPDIMDSQNGYLRDRVTDFVVMRLGQFEDPENLDIPYLYENYRLVRQQHQIYKDKIYNFVLFEVID